MLFTGARKKEINKKEEKKKMLLSCEEHYDQERDRQ